LTHNPTVLAFTHVLSPLTSRTSMSECNTSVLDDCVWG